MKLDLNPIIFNDHFFNIIWFEFYAVEEAEE
jgi:hypothetical protein